MINQRTTLDSSNLPIPRPSPISKPIEPPPQYRSKTTRRYLVIASSPRARFNKKQQNTEMLPRARERNPDVPHRAGAAAAAAEKRYKSITGPRGYSEEPQQRARERDTLSGRNLGARNSLHIHPGRGAAKLAALGACSARRLASPPESAWRPKQLAVRTMAG